MNNKKYAKGNKITYRYPRGRKLKTFRLIKVFENGHGVAISRNYEDAYTEFEENPHMIDFENDFGIVIVNLEHQSY